MKTLLQRVSEARVVIVESGEISGEIGHGLLVLICSEPDDGAEEIELFARKIVKMRLFEDGDGKMNKSVTDVGGGVLVVSQFTLAGTWRNGNRPGFSSAAPPGKAERDYTLLTEEIASHNVPVSTGRFRHHMRVELVNDGPVTIWMDSNDRVVK